MSATEKIGVTELSTYGLQLARLDGNIDLPPFKKIITPADDSASLKILDEQTVQIKLIGFYASKAILGTQIAAFQTKIKGTLKQIWTFTNHDFAETCVVKDGFQINTFGTAAEIDIKLTITEA
jgi:hypothetical protein